FRTVRPSSPSFCHPDLSAGTRPPENKYVYPSDLPHSVRVCALTSTQSIKRTATAITVRMNVLPCMAQLVTEYIAECKDWLCAPGLGLCGTEPQWAAPVACTAKSDTDLFEQRWDCDWSWPPQNPLVRGSGVLAQALGLCRFYQ